MNSGSSCSQLSTAGVIGLCHPKPNFPLDISSSDLILLELTCFKNANGFVYVLICLSSRTKILILLHGAHLFPHKQHSLTGKHRKVSFASQSDRLVFLGQTAGILLQLVTLPHQRHNGKGRTWDQPFRL